MPNQSIASSNQDASGQSGTGKPETRFEYIANLKSRVDVWLFCCIVGGLVATLVFGAMAGAKLGASSSWGYPLGALLAICIAGGALALGVMGGFLFGLPRALTSGEVREIARLNTSAAASAQKDAGIGGAVTPAGANEARRAINGGYGANTNLERISDWLTTIIVGLGLTNIGEAPLAIERFGTNTEAIFNFGGKAFGIGGGLYFLIFGFLMSYISTRTKLMLIFTENERDNDLIRSEQMRQAEKEVEAAVGKLVSAGPIEVTPANQGSGAGGAPASSQPNADVKLVLDNVSLQQKTTPDQMLALANASAKQGDYAKALVLYREYMREYFRDSVPDPQTAQYYASVLGMNGDPQGLEELKRSYANSTIVVTGQDLDEKFAQGAREALRSNLYNGRFEDSIRIGETLVSMLAESQNVWDHIWLACAYGQRHLALRSAGADPVAIDAARERAASEVEKVIQLDSDQASFLLTLYDPGKVAGDDNDLISLFPDARIDKALNRKDS